MDFNRLLHGHQFALIKTDRHKLARYERGFAACFNHHKTLIAAARSQFGVEQYALPAVTFKEYRMSADIELRVTPGKGEGIFALRGFAPGETVLKGVLESETVQNHSHASQLGENKFGFHGGLISKFNHSCDPNCGIRLNATGGHDFVAMNKIASHEEATFDYAMRNIGSSIFRVRAHAANGFAEVQSRDGKICHRHAKINTTGSSRHT